jgi:hypothetical protein
MNKKISYGRELPGYPFNTKAFITRAIIVAQRKLYGQRLRTISQHAPLKPDWAGQAANDAIRALLLKDSPCMIARFGSGEMETTLRHLDISCPGTIVSKILRLICGEIGPFWWDNSIRAGMNWIAGLYPPTDEIMDRFGARVLDDCREINILAGWLPGEKRLHALCFPHAKCVFLDDLEPFSFTPPWTQALEGKRVLVVHPFETTICRQYEIREHLFKDQCVLPAFTLKTYKPVQSLAGNPTDFPNWFDALDHMCNDLSKIDFDIALIGAGAYGMSIAAHIKRMGRKAVHMGGITQLLFGIKGGRWDNIPRFSQGLYNDHWIRPLPEERPNNYKQVENGSYW